MYMPFLWEDNWTIFETAKEKYGIWPLTVWPCDHSKPIYKKLKEEIGDFGGGRMECFTKRSTDKSIYRGKVTESIFNPQVALWVVNLYAPSEGTCFDPFAGGGTRAILVANHGMDYIGIELCREECERVIDRCRKNKVSDKVTIIEGDAKQCSSLVGKEIADFVFTCPPYWNLETYNGGKADLSICETYEIFLSELLKVIIGCYNILKPGSLSCWVVGLHRDSDGSLLALNHDIARLHKEVGYKLREEVILNHLNTGAILRVGNFEKGNKWLIRVHEYLLVFEKGNSR